MKKRSKNKHVKRSLFSVDNFIIFFISAVLMHTFNIIMFIKLSHIHITYKDAKFAVVSTIGNIIFLALVFSIFDNIRKNIQIKKPVAQILDATKRISEGDFSVRIDPINKKNRRNEFDVIIEYLNKMTQELSGIETFRTDFIANVSHELKTPIATIQNYAMLLQDNDIDEESKKQYTDTIIIATQRLTTLITNILKLNKLENQQIYPDVKDYNLSEQLRECILDFEQFWERKNLDVEIALDDELIINADEELVGLIWYNLISNAIKFTPENGKILIKTISDEKSVSVEITDTGCGIGENELPHIFDKFYQGDTSHATAGNGLGLALVKRVVDTMHGKITVQSAVGEGSTFTVRLNNFYF